MEFLSLFKEYQSTKLTYELKHWYNSVSELSTFMTIFVSFAAFISFIVSLNYLIDLTNFYIILGVHIFIFSIIFFKIHLYFKRKINEKYPKEAILFKIGIKIYNGSLYELFDKNCQYTNETLQKHKETLEQQSINRNGVIGYTLCQIQDEIDLLKDKNSKIILKELNAL